MPAQVREEIRTREARAMFAEEYGRPPVDARELSGYVARQSRPAQVATAGYDLTFTPPKSFSVLWGLELAERLAGIHDRAVTRALETMQTEAAFTRQGAGGVRQVETTGLLVARFDHRDNRAGEANLHTHAAVSNKVQARGPDGAAGPWLALDGRMIHRLAVLGSETYNAEIEALASAELGLRLQDRAARSGHGRPVREIVGVDAELNRINSSRSAQIEVRQAELALQFQREHGRAPTPLEAIRLAQTATLDTRQRKHEPRSLAAQRALWRAAAESALGAGSVERMVHATGAGRAPSLSQPDPAELARLRDRLARDVVAVVGRDRAQWQYQHVAAEALRQVRGRDLDPDTAHLLALDVADAALAANVSTPIGDVEEPVAGLDAARSDGTSAYVTHRSQTYTSAEVVAAERRIVEAGGRADGMLVPAEAIDLSLLQVTAAGAELNPGQASLVRELAGSGKRVQLALAPAGTGKTTAMRALSDAWREAGGQVIGLAPSAAAAIQLGEATGGINDTIDNLVFRIDRQMPLPDWAQQIDESSLILIDEAGMASTRNLDATIQFALQRGASVRLIGDDQQLASVAGGGVLRDLQAEHGALSLSDVVRFADSAEGLAGLSLRDGDAAAIAFYLDHGRVHVGDQTGAAEQAYAGWSADRAAGLDALMLAPTRDLTRALNDRARADRLAADGGSTGPEVPVGNGGAASAGDIVITRKNSRRLTLRGTDYVRNGYRWQVEQVHDDGSMTVRHLQQGVARRLPAWYLDEGHVELGYAATVHAAQGATSDAAHLIADPTASRQVLYVGMTRGRKANHVYVPVAGHGDEHSVPWQETASPQSGGEVLAAVLARDGAQVSASTALRRAADPRARLGFEVGRYCDSLARAGEQLLGVDRLAEIAEQLERTVPGVTGAPAWPTLRGSLALVALDGRDPLAVVKEAIGGRQLATARDAAAVVDWRIDPAHARGGRGPLPWLHGAPAALAEHPQWGEALRARAEQIAELARQVDALARTWSPGDIAAPAWARPLLAARAHPKLLAQAAVWRAAHGVQDVDRRIAGPPVQPMRERRIHQNLTDSARAFVDDSVAHGRRWLELGRSLDPRLIRDGYWPLLAARLDLAQRAGIGAEALVRAVAAERPLPDEQPAAALWWRLSRHLEHTAAVAAGGGAARPEWAAALDAALGESRAVVVMTDAMWPALVATVEQAAAGSHDPLRLLADAAAAVAASGDVAAGDTATAMLWRIGLLTDPDPVAADSAEQLPPDPAAADQEPPEDLPGAFIDEGIADAAAAVGRGLIDPQPEPLLEEDDDCWGPAAEDVAYLDEQQLRLENAAVRAPSNPQLAPAERAGALAADAETARHRWLAADQALARLEGGPHQLAAKPIIDAMRERAEALHPHVVDADGARELWAESAATAHEAAGRLAALQAAVAADRAAAPPRSWDDVLGFAEQGRAAAEARLQTAGGDDVGRLQELRDAAAAARQALAEARELAAGPLPAGQWEPELAAAQLLAGAAAQQAGDARAAYEQALAQLHDAAGGADRVITRRDVDWAREQARTLDYDAAVKLRAEWRRRQTELDRAEIAAARQASTAAEDAIATTMPAGGPAPASAAETDELLGLDDDTAVAARRRAEEAARHQANRRGQTRW